MPIRLPRTDAATSPPRGKALSTREKLALEIENSRRALGFDDHAPLQESAQDLGSDAAAPPVVPEPGPFRNDKQRKHAVREARADRAATKDSPRYQNERTEGEHIERDVANEDSGPLPRDVFLMCKQVVSSARQARYWLRWARSRYSGWALAKLRAATFKPQADGTCLYDFGDLHARRKLAEGLLLLRMGTHSSARACFGSRSMRRGLSVRGIPKGLIAKACTPSWRSQRPWHRNTLGNRGGDFTQLEQAGFFERKRLPVSRLSPYEIGNKSGQAISRYWIPCVATLEQRRRQARNSRSMTPLGASLSVHFDANEHEIGWQLCDEVIKRTVRLRSARPPP